MSVKLGATAVVLTLATMAPAAAQTVTPGASTGMKAEDGSNLSTKLSKSGGVITPKADVDPGMKVPAPAPHPNSTPVIPPSATGGNTAK